MAKTAYDTILELMIHAPRSIHNATVAYHLMLLVCGNGFLWNDHGRIIRKSKVDDETEEDANETENEELYSSKKYRDDFLILLEKAVKEQVNYPPAKACGLVTDP